MTAIIFDLDGTLVDSAPALTEIANSFMREEGLAPLNVAETKRYIGNGPEVFLERALAARSAADPAKFTARFARYQHHYAQAPGNANVPFPGVDEALSCLTALGHALGLCTNKPAAPTRTLLAALGWQTLFSVIIAGDTLAERKPDPTPLREAAKQLKRHPVIYVGDSEVDAQTATAAGIPFLLFTEGYRHAEVGQLPHAAAFSDYRQLPALILAITGPLAVPNS